ncbi:hypothetical protein ACIBJC_34750 [Streptomyces sp. NPDC050509]|uniref:hypothetical protein n=1 Tax=Streptomyces sp. NPDC050509 TaxID=3365620 RepID=UPI00378E6655
MKYPTVRQNTRARVEVSGERIPDSWFEGFADGSSPSLSLMELRIGSTPVSLTRRRWAVTKRGRSLRLVNAERKYTCTATGRGKGYVLARDGVRIKVAQKGHGKKKYQSVDVNGPADPVDISIAVVFTGANRANLTLGGAIRSAVARILDMFS